jgi:hypothetical protein
MKKLILTAAALLVTLSTYAQGTIDFRNDSTTVIRNDFKAGSPTVMSTEGILVALYWAPLSNPDNFTMLGTPTTVGAPPEPVPAGRGRFSGGNRTTGTETLPGDVARFIVRAWEAAYGATYELASAAASMNGRTALLGQSNIIIGPTGTTLSPKSLLAGDATTPLQAFSVNVVPEPSTIALGIIGAGALLLLRRRK